jgi:type I restriction enzyme, S subunit
MADPWPTQELGIAGVRVLDCEHRTPEEAKEGYPYIAIPNLIDGQLKLDNVRLISEEDFEVWTRRTKPRPGDIIVTRRGRVGDSAVIPCGVSCAIGQNLVILRSTGEVVNQEYLRWALRGPQWKSEVDRLHNVGAVFDSLNVSDIPRIRIPVPPAHFQRSISAILTALDDKIVVNQRLAKTSNDLMKALYERSVRQGVTTTSIGKVADLFDGPHATPNKTDSGPWFLSISSLKQARLVLSESAHLTQADFQRWTRRVVPRAGDVLFSYETRLGEAALMPPDVKACLGRRMALLRPRNGEVGPRTLLQAFLSKSFQSLIMQRAIHGATVDRIPLTALPSWPIDLPADNTRKLEDTLSSIDDTASSSERENERLAELRDTLLPLLMSGKILVRDAEQIVEDAT